jgi:hypothetical protein
MSAHAPNAARNAARGSRTHAPFGAPPPIGAMLAAEEAS